ncbi:MAG: HYR domain-containing protein [Acholeplasmataceae bacterium]|jgi:hypothetical protein|nr:HYR domain-containing protein [Acholeplasmataceae bacterium]
MHKFHKLVYLMVLLIGAITLSSSVTFAASSPNVTYGVQDNYVYIEIDGHMNLNEVDNWPINLQADYRDSGILQTPTKFMIDVTIDGNSQVFEFDILFSDQMYGWVVLRTDQFGSYVDFETDQGEVYSSGTLDQLSPADEIYMAFMFPYADASPVLTGETAFVTNVDAPLSEASIRSNIYAFDETDGDITHLITKTSDTYTPNMNTVGTWQIVYSVQDTASNITTLTVHVLVRDVTAPTWNVSKAEVEVSYVSTFDIEAYKSQLGISDNYDPVGSLTITVQSNTYTANKSIVGTYYVVYKIKDTAGNETLAEVEVQVIDTVAPTISGPTTIVKPNNSALTVSEIKTQLTANDVVSGNVTASIVVSEDNYTGKGHLVGSYTIKFSVTDPSGNTANHTVTVTVEDNIPPIFYIKDNYFITVDQSVALTLGQIIDILEITGQLETSGSGGVELTALINEYTGHEHEPGIYAVSLKAVSNSGNESIHNVAIEVMESSEDDPIVIDEPSEWDDVWAFVKDHQDYFIGGIAILIVLMFTLIKIKNSKKTFVIKKRNKKRH